MHQDNRFGLVGGHGRKREHARARRYHALARDASSRESSINAWEYLRGRTRSWLTSASIAPDQPSCLFGCRDKAEMENEEEMGGSPAATAVLPNSRLNVPGMTVAPTTGL